MKLFTLKYLFLTTVFMLFGCLSIQASDDDLITEQITIKLDKAGTLPNKIESSKKYKITNLKIVGEINGTDLRMIREMAGLDYEANITEGKLSVLDLSETKIVVGGDYYYNSYKGGIYTSNDEIGDFAFWNCSGLTSLTLPSGITQIGESAFSGCSGLTSLALPSGITKIGVSAFNGCSGLTSLTLPSGITKIEGGTFGSCRSLTNLVLPSGITEIGNYAFSNCNGLTSLTLLSGITKIGDNAFSGCRGLTSLSLPSSITELGDGAFKDCSGLTSLTLPAGITKIGTGTFWNCSGLTSLTLPANLIEIGRNSFMNCSGLTSLALPAGITKIGCYAFLDCSSLTSLEIPSSVKTIGEGALGRCFSLSNIVCLPIVAPSIFPDENLSNSNPIICEKELKAKITLIVPLEASGYMTGEWSLFKKPEEIRLTDTQCSIANQGYCPIGKFSYSRTQMKSGSYATFCLPFDTNLSEVSDKFEAVYIPNQTALLNPDGKLILLLQKYDKNASLAAGQAVVVKLKSGVTDVAFSNNKLMMVESDAMQNSEPTSLHVFDWNGNSGALLENTDIKVSFGGTLTSMTGKGSEYETFNSNGSFGPTKSGVVKAFRAYVLKENAAANSRIKSIAFGLGDDSETTGVKMISIPVENKQGDDVYTIDGRLINNTGDIEELPSGIYIKNHQKIYVK